MTVTKLGTLDALHAMSILNLTYTSDGQADLWASVLNDAAPQATDADLARAVRHLAATRTTEQRGQRVTPADLLRSIDGAEQAQRAHRLELLDADARAHGQVVAPQEICDDAALGVRWVAAARNAIGSGATRPAAVAAGWRAIGREPAPALPEGRRPIDAVIRHITGRRSA